MSDADEEMLAFMAEINSIPAEKKEETQKSEEVEAPAAKVQKVAALCVAASKPVYNTELSSSSAKIATDSTLNSSSNDFIPPIPSEPRPMPSNFQQIDPKTGEAKMYVRKGADGTWTDPTLSEWPENDFRLFVGDLSKETTERHLADAFKHYKSFAKAKVVNSTSDVKSRGFGFVSFLDPMDCAKALREMNGKYLGNRPMKISKSTWKDRDLGEVKKKNAKKRKMEQSLGIR